VVGWLVGLVGPLVGRGVGGVVSPPGKVEPISPILMLENLMLALGKLASMSDGTPESLLELQAGYGSKTM